MPFLLKDKTQNTGVFIWVSLLTLMVLIIIVIGGLTRLTNSGLSMVDWKPLLGILPPLNEQAWIEVFSKYKLTPEYLIVNTSMTINEFKYIFWWEWIHRFIARCIGIVFVLPLIYFYFKKKLTQKTVYKLIIILIFGFFQAFIGWWMVKSGLNDNPYVSAYRLAFHLTNALIIFSLLFWLTLSIYFGKEKNNNVRNYIMLLFQFSLILLFITIISGAFMAGTDAGKSFNTFPLMNNQLFPEDYFLYKDWWKNFFENTVAINFNHRWLAIITFVFITSTSIFSLLYKKGNFSKFSIYFILIILFLQILLGIVTLIFEIPIILASLHQTNAVLLLASLLFAYHRLIYK